MKPMYIQSPENTLASLVHGMLLFDGIEFDIRLTSDNQVVIHHDRTVSVDPSRLSGRSPFVEDWTLDCLLYTSPSPRDLRKSRMPSSA